MEVSISHRSSHMEKNPQLKSQSAETLLTKPQIVRKLEFSEGPTATEVPKKCLQEDGTPQYPTDIPRTQSPMEIPRTHSPTEKVEENPVFVGGDHQDSGESSSDDEWEHRF